MKKSYIKRIIKEEVNDVIQSRMPVKEQLADNEFISQVKVDMDDSAMIRYGIIQKTPQVLDIGVVRDKKVALKWRADFEYRSWGIKSISPAVPNQKINVIFENNELDTPEEFEREIDIVNAEVELDMPEEMFKSINLFPHLIEIYDDEITVHFDI